MSIRHICYPKWLSLCALACAFAGPVAADDKGLSAQPPQIAAELSRVAAVERRIQQALAADVERRLTVSIATAFEHQQEVFARLLQGGPGDDSVPAKRAAR